MYAKYRFLRIENDGSVAEPQMWMTRQVGCGRAGAAARASGFSVDLCASTFQRI